MAKFTLGITPPKPEGEEEAPKEFKQIPAGTILLAEVVDVQVRESFFFIDKDDESKGKQMEVNFKFAILEEGEYKGWKVFGSTPTTYNDNEKCKLRHWVEEIYAFDQAPVEFDSDLLVGEPVNVVIGHKKPYTKKDGTAVGPKAFVENLVRYTDNYEEEIGPGTF